MNFLLWITVGFIVIGFVVLALMKKSMERKLALIKNEESMESEQISTKPIVWWIRGATVWGLVSMFLIVWSFTVYM